MLQWKISFAETKTQSSQKKVIKKTPNYWYLEAVMDLNSIQGIYKDCDVMWNY